MKTPGIPLVCLTLLLGGCALVPAPYSDQLDPVGASYSAIKTGVSRVQVEAQLGRPNRVEEDGPCIWETRIDALNYAMVRIWFDHENRARKVEITRAHGKITPSYQASAVTTRIK